MVGGPRAYQDQFVGSSLSECMLVGIFSCIKKMFGGQPRERELATFDENQRAMGMLKPTRDKKIKARSGGEQGRHL